MEYTIRTFLEELGLTRNEMKVYLAAVEIGESTAADIARAARVHRVAAYAVIDALVRRGLITRTHARHGKRIQAAHPRQLRELIKKEERRMKKMAVKAEALIPAIAALAHHASARPRVRFYEDVQGLADINADIIETLRALPQAERITHSYSNPNIIHERFEDYVRGDDGYVAQRMLYGIRNKAIALDGPVTQEMVKRDEDELRETIVLPEKQFPYKNDITIYGNKIAIQALSHELVGVVIESKEIVEDQRAIFSLAWRGATLINESNA